MEVSSGDTILGCQVCLSERTHCFVFQNKLGDTALHAAAWKGHSDIVEMLLKKSEWRDSCFMAEPSGESC